MSWRRHRAAVAAAMSVCTRATMSWCCAVHKEVWECSLVLPPVSPLLLCSCLALLLQVDRRPSLLLRRLVPTITLAYVCVRLYTHLLCPVGPVCCSIYAASLQGVCVCVCVCYTPVFFTSMPLPSTLSHHISSSYGISMAPVLPAHVLSEELSSFTV